MFPAIARGGYASWLDDKEAKALDFTVTAIDDRRASRIIAVANNVTWAAYSAAIPKQTHGRLVLHQKARIIAQHPSEVA